MPIALGRVLLEAPLGTGGTGEVWRGAVPLPRGVLPVAVKLLARSAEGPYRPERLVDEVRAVARFRHPHIVRVFDTGIVEQHDAEGSSGALSAGTPYLVMELCSGGPLRRAGGWDEVLAAATALLRALAHAHARGVLHRDLKPANVLYAVDGDLRPGLKLVDWGIAWELDHAERRTAGTPAYMAPEQVAGRWADWSPATDLYALGCVLWEMIAHRRPFDATTREGWADAHLHHEPRALDPAVAVPAGTEAWLRRLLEKHPADRYTHAADALRTLLALGPAAGERPIASRSMPAATETLTASTLCVPSAPVARRHALPPPRPALSDEWPPEHADPPLLELGLASVGEGLVGARPPPLVGRDDARRQLWAALHEVERERRPVAVLLRGPAGVGTSRLAAALCEQAAEQGAVALRATHDPVPGPMDGLPGLLARHLRCAGEPAEVVRERVGAAVPAGTDPHDALGLAEMIAPTGAITFDGAAHRYAILSRMLAALARTRPVLIWLDDAHLGPEGLGLAAHLCRAGVPALVVLTCPDEAEIPPIPGLRVLELAPLTPADMGRLVRETLDLSAELARRVEERAAGNPGYAVALLHGYAQRGRLVPSETGYRLPDGASPELPSDVLAAWAARVQSVAADRAAIELLAAGGTTVLLAEWVAVCQATGVDERALGPWLGARLVHRDSASGALVFAHAMARDAVAAIARGGERWIRDHRAWAAVCERSGAFYRAARHRLEAGDAARGLDLLVAELDAQYGRAGPRTSLDLLDLFEQLASTEEQLAYARITRAEVLSTVGNYDAALAMARGLLVDGPAEQHASAHHLIGRVYRKLGRLADAVPHLEQASAGYALRGVRVKEGACWLALGHIERLRGAVEAAERCFERTIALDDTPLTQAWVEHALCTLAGTRMDDAAIERHAQRALSLFEQQGVPGGVAHSLVGLAEAWRHRGGFERAAALYERALSIYEQIGSDGRFVARLNLALTTLASGRHDAARPAFEQSRREMAARGRKMLVAGAELGLAHCAAVDGRWEAWHAHLDGAVALIEETGAVDPDLAALAEGAAAAAIEAGRPREAERASAIAAAQRSRLGGRADRVPVGGRTG